MRVVETRKKVLGEEHPDTLKSIGNVGHTRKCQGHNQSTLKLTKTCAALHNDTCLYRYNLIIPPICHQNIVQPVYYSNKDILTRPFTKLSI